MQGPRPKLTSEVIDFMAEAKQHGYGSEWGNNNRLILPEGLNQITYTQGNLKYLDTWSGGNPFKGSEDICWQQQDGTWRPIWGLTYMGEVSESLDPEEADAAIKTLQRALTNPVPNFPARGSIVTLEELRYSNECPSFSKIESFDFIERVKHIEKGSVYYLGRITGTLVNRSVILESSGQTPWFE